MTDSDIVDDGVPLRATRSVVGPANQRQIRRAAKQLGIKFGDEKEADSYLENLNTYLQSVQAIDKLPDFVPKSPYPRSDAYRPLTSENPHNGWYMKVQIDGQPEGSLCGKKIAIKDNVCIAGVPMMNGCSILEGYIPDVDATVVRRLLDAGGTILGKANCESLSFSGSSNTNSTGLIHNPLRQGYSAGGSSSGSAVLVASGEVDIAMGGDQGGSIRIPASFCGIYGMKPTYGLVPTTGIYSILHGLDHTGPMTANVKDNALALEALAGPDGFDLRQGPFNAFPEDFSSCVPLKSPKGNDYLSDIEKPIRGMKIGIVKEGFNKCDSCVIEGVRNAGRLLKDQLGCQVDEISVPFHNYGEAIWCTFALSKPLIDQNFTLGSGVGFKGLYPTSLMEYTSKGMKLNRNGISETGKIACLTSQHIHNLHGEKFHAKASNLALRLSQDYDKALSEYDVLLMPTLPYVATPLNDTNAPPEVVMQRGLSMLCNTTACDMTGHPAFSIPCGLDDKEGLPIGLMIIGRKLDEKKMYRVAYNLEKSFDWRSYTTPTVTKSRL